VIETVPLLAMVLCGCQVAGMVVRHPRGLILTGQTEVDTPRVYSDSSPQGIGNHPDFTHLVSFWSYKLEDWNILTFR